MKRLCFTLLVVLLGSGCSARQPDRFNLNSVAWMQSSEEYRALTLGAYSIARQNLDQALQDRTWTALPSQVPTNSDQVSALGRLEPAVILDIDETVLSTLPYQAWLVKNRKPFTLASWHAWVSEASAEAISGAAEFVRYAMAKGVTVFYLSNRRYQGPLDVNGNGQIDAGEAQAMLKPFTVSNLKRLGFLPQKNIADDDAVLLRGGTGEDGRVKTGWASSDKFARRESLAADYRVVLIMGDHLNDFISERKRHTGEAGDILDGPDADLTRWGRSWIMLPNPIYGAWESRHYDVRRPLSLEEKIQLKLNHLDTWQ